MADAKSVMSLSHLHHLGFVVWTEALVVFSQIFVDGDREGHISWISHNMVKVVGSSHDLVADLLHPEPFEVPSDQGVDLVDESVDHDIVFGYDFSLLGSSCTHLLKYMKKQTYPCFQDY
jgi:hypothetical protein